MRLVGVSLVLMFGCSPSGEGGGTAAARDPVPMTFDAWKAANPCPAGSRLDVREDDLSKHAYCIQSDDTKNGPTGSWRKDGTQESHSVYDHDRQLLDLTWDAQGKPVTREVTRPDGKIEFTLWGTDGKPTTRLKDER